MSTARAHLPVAPEAGTKDRAGAELVLAGALALFVVWFLACALSLERDAAMDDAYITYVYGRNFAEGHGLRFNPSDAAPTPGASSLLHAFFAAAASASGADPLVATRILGILAVVATGLVLGLTAARALRAPLGAGALVGAWLALGLALLPETVQHVAGGMETLLFVFVHAVYLAWMVRAADVERPPGVLVQVLGGVLAGIAVLTRPEGAAVACVTLVCLVWRHAATSGGILGSARRLAWALGSSALVVVAFLAWHRVYFDALFPNAFYVKTQSAIFGGGGLPGLASTLAFAWQRVLPLLVLAYVLTRVAGAGAAWRGRLLLLLPSVLVLLSLTRVIREMAGGFRYEFGMVVPFVLLVGIAALEVRQRSRAGFAGLVLATGACLPVLFAPPDAAYLNWLAHPRSPTAKWRQSGPQPNALAALGQDLARSGLGERATILLSGAGQVPYWSRFRAIDWVGLNDSYLSGREPRTLDEVWSYIDAAQPDAVMSVLPPAALDGAIARADDPNFASPLVQRFLGGFASELFERWDRERVAEMFRREMGYLREHYEFGVCYELGKRWRADWWLFVYVRRSSPHRDALHQAFAASPSADRTSDLSQHYPFDPRALGARP
ncbi:MAG: hypothetical protein L6Q99_10065 [Planctomycetes bacterium]|nr:hypothetical protein [Planctomycetota bacterium]